MRLCKKIKIEVGEQDAATLEWMQGKCRGLYNWWVMGLREGSKRWPGVNTAKKTLAESRAYDPELDGVYGKLLQEEIRDSRLIVFHDCGHLPHEEFPEAFTEVVSNFCSAEGDAERLRAVAG